MLHVCMVMYKIGSVICSPLKHASDTVSLEPNGQSQNNAFANGQTFIIKILILIDKYVFQNYIHFSALDVKLILHSANHSLERNHPRISQCMASKVI